ncbi:MAG: hypothetical protein V1709_05405 [Planctomycetota bacterium]
MSLYLTPLEASRNIVKKYYDIKAILYIMLLTGQASLTGSIKNIGIKKDTQYDNIIIIFLTSEITNLTVGLNSLTIYNFLVKRGVLWRI